MRVYALVLDEHQPGCNQSHALLLTLVRHVCSEARLADYVTTERWRGASKRFYFVPESLRTDSRSDSQDDDLDS